MVNISTCNARSPPVMASIYFIPWVKYDSQRSHFSIGGIREGFPFVRNEIKRRWEVEPRGAGAVQPSLTRKYRS